MEGVHHSNPNIKIASSNNTCNPNSTSNSNSKKQSNCHFHSHSVSISSMSSQTNMNRIIKRYQSQQLETFTNIDRNEIFSKVLKFLHYIIPDQHALEKLIVELNFQKEDQCSDMKMEEIDRVLESRSDVNIDSPMKKGKDQVKVSKFSEEKENQDTNRKSRYQCQKGKRTELDLEEPEISQEQLEKMMTLKKLKANCKISIMAMDNLLSDNDLSSPLISMQSIKNLSSMNLPSIPLSLQKIQEIYEKPEPFLITCRSV